MSIDSAVPRSVRIAGVLVGLQGLTGLIFAIALVVLRRSGGLSSLSDLLAEAGFFAVMAATIIAVAVGLLRGSRWSRTPAAVLEVLLVGIAWYAGGPSGQLAWGLGVAALCVLILLLLFTASARAWAIESDEPADVP
ncbi:MAG: hypothetical protein ACRDRO_03455 [Pseudonocardiaceae bacterium]